MQAKVALEIQNGILQNGFSGAAVQADSGHGEQPACHAKMTPAKVTGPKQK
jgi:hypothetical protein